MAGCIFCGRTPQTETHVFRKAWLKKVMASGGRFHHRHLREGPDGFDRRWSKGEFGIAPGAACTQCNSGWMHRLEHQAEALVEPCLLGHANVFDADVHAMVARWIEVCAAILDLTQGTPVVEPEQHHALYTRTEPIEGSFVWLAATNDPRDEMNGRPRIWIMHSSDKPNGYFCTFRIKHFVAQTFIPLSGAPKDLTFQRGSPGHVCTLWPSPKEPIEWPPPLVLRREEIEDFMTTFTN